MFAEALFNVELRDIQEIELSDALNEPEVSVYTKSNEKPEIAENVLIESDMNEPTASEPETTKTYLDLQLPRSILRPLSTYLKSIME